MGHEIGMRHNRRRWDAVPPANKARRARLCVAIRVIPWDAPHMRVSTDDRCRIQSRELFKPNTRYEGEFAADGSIRLIEWVEKQTPKARLVRRKGRTFLESARPITNEDVAAVLEVFP